MYGAIIGDIAGSIYEYDQFNNIHPIVVDNIIPDEGFYSDDSVLTMAILDAILNDKDYEKYLRKYAKEFIDYKPKYEPFFNCAFGHGFMKWLESNERGVSKGNGAMMRISPVGYMFDTIEEVKENVKAATIPSHDNPESIACAEIIALLIFYFRNGYSKEEAFKLLNIDSLNYIPFQKFNSTCGETINNCLYAIYKTNSFEEAIKTVLSYGGDTDTNACIVGSVCEALYGIDQKYIDEVNKRIPDSFKMLLEKGYKK